MVAKMTPAAYRGAVRILAVVLCPILLSMGGGMIMLGIFGEADPLSIEVAILVGSLAILAAPALIAWTVHLYRWRPEYQPFEIKRD